MSTVIELVDGYDRGTKAGKRKLQFRNPINVQEMIEHCSAHSHIWFASNDGSARQCKVNGKVRTWKRDKNRVEVPVKYGLYEYGTFDARDIQRILIPLPDMPHASDCATYVGESCSCVTGKPAL
jgi:hypothetical protein